MDRILTEEDKVHHEKASSRDQNSAGPWKDGQLRETKRFSTAGPEWGNQMHQQQVLWSSLLGIVQYPGNPTWMTKFPPILNIPILYELILVCQENFCKIHKKSGTMLNAVGPQIQDCTG